MKFVLNDNVYISGLPKTASQKLKCDLSIINPEIAKLERLGRYSGNMPEVISFYEESSTLTGEKVLICPKGYAEEAYRRLKEFGSVEVIDKRLELPDTPYTFTGRLKPFQEQGLQQMIPHSSGILVFPTGGGKTVAMLNLIAQRRQPALVIVDKKELLYQWQDRAATFLDIPIDEIGLIGGGKFAVGERLTIGTIQTIAKHIDSLRNSFGLVVVDECHKAGAATFRNTISQFTAKYIHGCTATPIRNDGLMQAVLFYLGKVRFTIDKKTLLDNGDLCKAVFKQIETGFDTLLDGTMEYVQIMTELVEDHARNDFICRYIADAEKGGLSLILSGRVTHCDKLKAMLGKYGVDAAVLTGSTHCKERKKILQDLQAGKIDYLISTTSLLKEGFDLPILQKLYLVYPVKWKGAVIQTIGRILRPASGKEYAEIHDFTDNKVGVLKNSARGRARIYREQNILQLY